MFDVRLDIALVIPNTITISRDHMLTNKFRMVLFKKKILYKRLDMTRIYPISQLSIIKLIPTDLNLFTMILKI